MFLHLYTNAKTTKITVYQIQKIVIGDVVTKEIDYTWLNKVIDLHEKHGLKEVNMAELRKVSNEDALKAAEYFYKDYIINVGHPERPELKMMSKNLEDFTVEEKPRVVGALHEVTESCLKKDSLVCNTDDIKNIAKEWGVDPHKLIRAYFEKM